MPRVFASTFRSGILLSAAALSACAALPAAGPMVPEIEHQTPSDPSRGFVIVNIDNVVVNAASRLRRQDFGSVLASRRPPADLRIAVGDVLQIAIIEVGSGLFGQTNNAATLGAVTVNAQTASLQPITVPRDGYISVPFAGRIYAVGKTPDELRRRIEHLLSSKAQAPQVELQILSDGGNSATIGGAVNHPGLIPLPLYGARLMDVIAAAGGARFAPYDVKVHITRGGRTEVVSLQSVVDNPKGNIYIQPHDNIYLTNEPRSFTAFGATTKVDHYPFGQAQLSLAEAIARTGGPMDKAGDPGGAFLFRFEPKEYVETIRPDLVGRLSAPMIPVVYRLNLRQAQGYFYAQNFPMRDKDVILVADAEATQLLKFMVLVRGITGAISELNSKVGTGSAVGTF